MQVKAVVFSPMICLSLTLAPCQGLKVVSNSGNPISPCDCMHAFAQRQAGNHLLAVIKHSLHRTVSCSSHCWVDLTTYGVAAAAATGYLLLQICWGCLQSAQDDPHDLQATDQVS